MRILSGAILALLMAQPASAQAIDGTGAVLRWLDKVSGESVDIELPVGEFRVQGRLTITLNACRYPAEGEPTSAYAHLIIHDGLVTTGPVFAGWMVADSPALHALDHSRYDVWVIRCTTS
jgi:hypothetical protein